MSIKDWYKEYLSRKEQEKQSPLTVSNNSDFKGYSNPVQSAINKEVFDNYMNQGNDAQKIQDSQQLGNTDTAGKVASGFAEGGLIGALAAAAESSKERRKTAMRNSEAIGKVTMQNAERQNQALMNDLDVPNTTLNYNPNNYNYNNTVGGAAPVTAPDVQQLTPIQEYQNALRQQGYSDDVINGVPQGLNSGYKEIDDWIRQYNEGSGRNNPINIPQTEEEIAAARAGNFNVPTQTASTEENIKRGLLDKFISGISDFSRGYQENRNTKFAPENLQRDDSKSKMNRLGEAVGTIGRVTQNPFVQGALATAASAAMGNPFALAQGYKFANQRAMSDVYANILKQYGVNVPDTGAFGNISGSDILNIGNMAETHAWHEYMNKRYADELAAKIAKYEADKKYKEDRIEVMQQNADTNKQRVENQKNKPVKTTKTSGGSSKSTYQLVNGKDGNVYRLNKNTGEYQVVGSKSSGDGGVVTTNKDIVVNKAPETEAEFRNRVFKKKQDNGWAF